VTGLRSGSLFSGYGGLDMAVEAVFGARPAWFSEIEPAPSKILAHHWPDAPNHGDITAINWDQVEPVDILTGGFPCQDVSHAGKRAGMHPDTRSGLWTHMAYAISKLRPRLVVAENVRGLLSADAHSEVEPCPWCLGDAGGESYLRALGAVLGDLADLGYDAWWHGLRAADVGAPHGRFRVFILAAVTARTRRDQHGRRDDARRAVTVASPVADTRGVSGEPGRIAAPRQAAIGRARRELAGRDGTPPADTDRDPVREQPVSLARGSDPAIPRLTVWGPYGPAVDRWGRVLGRVAPAPTETSPKGSQRLSPAFVEWMMGLPLGHVTAVPGLSRNDQLKALGNGVVPQQAEAALRMLHGAALGVAS
jgi:DNA (cytosine-5)-methyltransferase 1